MSTRSNQLYRVINLDKKQVLDPRRLGKSHHYVDFAFTGSPVMGGLLCLLSGSWSGDHVAIIGDCAQDTDLPVSEELCGIPASQLAFHALHGHEPFKSVSKKIREVLSANYGYLFQERTVITTTFSAEGVKEDTESTVELLGVQEAPVTNSSSEMDQFVVINRTKRQFIDSRDFFEDASLRQAISNPRNEQGDRSWLPAALAVLLTTSMEKSVFFVPDDSDEDFSGSWAGDDISVENYAFADLARLENISSDLKTAMSNAPGVATMLSPRS